MNNQEILENSEKIGFYLNQDGKKVYEIKHKKLGHIYYVAPPNYDKPVFVRATKQPRFPSIEKWIEWRKA